MTEMIVIGAGLYAAPMIELARASGYSPVAIYDRDSKMIGNTILNVPVMGTDDDLFGLDLAGKNLAIAIGNNSVRLKLFDAILLRKGILPALIHPTAFVSRSASVGRGCYIQPHAIIWPQVRLNDSVIISPSTMISHHTVIERGCMISTLTSVGSNISIGKSVFIGMGCTIMTGVREIGDYAIVGAGSVVIKDVEPGATVVGVPAKRIK